jgi:phosphatidylinositol-3-phosphatase
MQTLMRSLVIIALALAAAVASAPAAQARPALAAAAVPSPLCGALTGAPVDVRHVLVVVMENHSYRDVIGPRGSAVAAHAPFINRTLKRGCGLATAYRAVTHPSLPNYLALVAGTRGGIATDCTSCTSSAPTLFERLAAAGRGWRIWAESMPGRCSQAASSGEYLKRHNPATYFPAIAASCARWDVPMGGATGRFARALSGGPLPAYGVVVPNACNDMHDCSVATGDRWLARWIPRIAATPSYRAGHTVVFVVWDEGQGGGYGGENCLRAVSDESCHVAALVLSEHTRPGTRSSEVVSHYSVLRAAQALLGSRPFLGKARTAPSLRAAFGLAG